MSLLTEDGKLYLIAGDHEPLNKELAPLAAKTACTGQLRREREGESAHRKAVAEAGDDYGSVSRFGNETPTAERIQMKKRIIIIGLLAWRSASGGSRSYRQQTALYIPPMSAETPSPRLKSAPGRSKILSRVSRRMMSRSRAMAGSCSPSARSPI